MIPRVDGELKLYWSSRVLLQDLSPRLAGQAPLALFALICALVWGSVRSAHTVEMLCVCLDLKDENEKVGASNGLDEMPVTMPTK